MNNDNSKEKNSLQQENRELKQKLEDIQTVIGDIFDKNTKDGDADLYLDALIRIEKIVREPIR